MTSLSCTAPVSQAILRASHKTHTGAISRTLTKDSSLMDPMICNNSTRTTTIRATEVSTMRVEVDSISIAVAARADPLMATTKMALPGMRMTQLR